MPPYEPGGEGGSTEEIPGTEVEVALNDAELRAGLVAACKLGRVDAVGALIERGADFQYLDSRGWGPLHWACFYGHHAIVEVLMRVGAGDMYRDGPSFTGLVSPGMTSPGGVMSPGGGTVSPSSGAGAPRFPNVVNSPLHIALSRGYVRCVWGLLAAGVSPLDVDAAGNSALHVAASSHPPSPTLRLELLTSCMYAGCDPTAKNWRGFTALDLLPSGDGAARALLARAASATQCASTGVVFSGDSLRYLCASTGLFYSEGASTQAFVHAFAPALPGVTLPTPGYPGASSPLPDPVIDGASAGFVTCNDIPIAVWEGDEGLLRPIRLATEACSRVADAEAALEGALRPLQGLVQQALERKAKEEEDRLNAQMDAARAAAAAAAAAASAGEEGEGGGSSATGAAPPTPVKGDREDGASAMGESSSSSSSSSSNSSSPSVEVPSPTSGAAGAGAAGGFPASPLTLEGVSGVGGGSMGLGSPMDSPTSPTPTLSGLGWGEGLGVGGGGGYNTLGGQRGGGRGGVPPLPLYSPPLELYAEPSHLEAIQGALAACLSARCDVAVVAKALGALATVAAAGRAVAAAGALAAARPLPTRYHPTVAALEEAGREARVFGAGKSFLGQLALARASAIAELELLGAKEAAERVPLATHAHDAIISRLTLALDTVVALEGLAVRGGSGEEGDAVSEEDIAQCLDGAFGPAAAAAASATAAAGEGKEGEEASQHTSSSPTSTLRLGVTPISANAPPCPPTPSPTMESARALKQRLVAEVALSDAVAKGMAAMHAHAAAAAEFAGEDPTLLPTPPLPPPPAPEGGAAAAQGAAAAGGGKGGAKAAPPPPPAAKPGKGAPVVEEPPPHPPVDPTLPCDAAGVPLPHSKQLLALFELRDSLAALEGGLGEGAAAGADGVALEAAKAALDKAKVALEEGLMAECLRCEDFRKKKKKKGKGGAKKK